MTSDKALETVEKLLRLAAPTSGAPKPERENAALRAAELIAEHGLVVRPAKGGRVASSVWVLTVAIDYCSCAKCNNRISPRDIAWVRILPDGRKEFRHNYSPCAVN